MAQTHPRRGPRHKQGPALPAQAVPLLGTQTRLIPHGHPARQRHRPLGKHRLVICQTGTGHLEQMPDPATGDDPLRLLVSAPGHKAG